MPDKDMYDPLILGARVDEKLHSYIDQISYRAAAKEIGISSTTVGRVVNGKLASAETLLRVCLWLNLRGINELLESLNA